MNICWRKEWLCPLLRDSRTWDWVGGGRAQPWALCAQNFSPDPNLCRRVLVRIWANMKCLSWEPTTLWVEGQSITGALRLVEQKPHPGPLQSLSRGPLCPGRAPQLLGRRPWVGSVSSITRRNLQVERQIPTMLLVSGIPGAVLELDFWSEDTVTCPGHVFESSDYMQFISESKDTWVTTASAPSLWEGAILLLE